MTPSWGEEITSTKPRWKRVFVCIFLLFVLCCYVSPPGPTQYIFHTPMAQYSLFVLKVSINTNKTNKQVSSGSTEGVHSRDGKQLLPSPRHFSCAQKRCSCLTVAVAAMKLLVGWENEHPTCKTPISAILWIFPYRDMQEFLQYFGIADWVTGRTYGL